MLLLIRSFAVVFVLQGAFGLLQNESADQFQLGQAETATASSGLLQQGSAAHNFALADKFACQRWSCASHYSCSKSQAVNGCFKAHGKIGADLHFDLVLDEALENDQEIVFDVKNFACGNGRQYGQTTLKSYDSKGGEVLCSDSPPENQVLSQLRLKACQGASYLYFRTADCEQLPEITSIGLDLTS